MKKIRIVSFLLAMILLCSGLLVACGGEDEGGKAGGDVILNTKEADTSKILDLEKKDLGGHEFRFLATKDDVANDLMAEAVTGDKLNDAVFARNAQIEKEYNCKIIVDWANDAATSCREPLMAGEYVADFIYAGIRSMHKLAGMNLLYDTSKSEYINFEKAWWDQAALDGLNIGGRIFVTYGDATIRDDLATFLSRVNFDFLSEYDDSIDLYQEVRDGKWTIDRMYELVSNTAKDLNGDGFLIGTEDRFGYNAEPAVNYAHVAACGVTLSDRDDAGNFELPAQVKPAVLDAWAALKPLLTSPTRLNDWRGLADGLCTFYTCNTRSLLSTMDSGYDIGVLPLPKLNEDQKEHYTTVYFSQISGFAIPNTVANAEDAAAHGFTDGIQQACYFLEVFSYYSMNIITPAFFDQVLIKQGMRNSESIEMMEIAIKNKIFDPVVGLNFGGMYMFNDIGSPGKRVPGSDINYETLASTYESRLTAARKALQNYLTFVNTESLDAI
ncbi:MAG: hypothetical protein IKJ74_03810 [Clostridia bacterium]|nr:hypothetical protein [Clostridia bacterium]